MLRMHSILALGLAATALASCSKSGIDPIAAAGTAPARGPSASPPEPVAATESADGAAVVITGTRIAQPNLVSSVPITVIGSAARSSTVYAPPPPAPLQYQPPFNPPDVGRDRFTSVSENMFKAVAQE